MGLHKAYLGRLTIASGQTQSNILKARELAMAAAIVFYTPAAFTGTISVYVGQDEDFTLFSELKPLFDGGAAVTIGANRAERRNVNGFESVAVQSGAAEGAQRDIEVFAVLDLSDGG